MGEVVDEINAQSGGMAAIVTDVGQHQMVACRYAKFNRTRSNITSGGLGTMGFCLTCCHRRPRWALPKEK